MLGVDHTEFTFEFKARGNSIAEAEYQIDLKKYALSKDPKYTKTVRIVILFDPIRMNVKYNEKGTLLSSFNEFDNNLEPLKYLGIKDMPLMPVVELSKDHNRKLKI